jgi:hypothetical protein
MWVVADTERLRKAVGTAAPPAADATEETAPAAAPKAETETKETPVEKAIPDRASETALKGSIKNKLQFLKELRDEMLISEEDYNFKKKELLDKIK